MITPYLKGVHLMLESWRPNRDVDGWKFSKKQWLEILEEADWNTYEESGTQNAPDYVKAVPRLGSDLEALHTLSKSETPSHCLVRGVSVNHTLYGFVDASGGGFGSTFWAPGSNNT
eukprot:6688368-Ditylum_brightwellii.AAC.1